MSTTISDRLLDSLPMGVERAILRILSFHKGRSKAISRDDLLYQLRSYNGIQIDDRQMRAVIAELKKSGELICSAGGVNGGYWIAADWSELKEYHSTELHTRAMEMLEQESAQRAAAEKLWGPESHQISLGI